jgi:catechol 2,3-dioxygenase-like lactoylglutathione lyase family enzyme
MGTSSLSMKASIEASSSVTSAGMDRSKGRHSLSRRRRPWSGRERRLSDGGPEEPATSVDYRVPMAVRAIGINHVAFEVRDLDEALQWWGRWFAFELRGRRATMAWLDLGDQFVALSQVADGAGTAPDAGRHVGLVVDDKEALRAALREAGEDVRPSGSLRVRDPSGNLIEIVDYRDVQFSKSAAVLRGMGLAGLEKSASARQELAEKGLLGDPD